MRGGPKFHKTEVKVLRAGLHLCSRNGFLGTDVTANLFRGPEQIYTGRPIAPAIANGSSAAVVHAASEIKLPATLPRGDYALELVVNDRLEKLNQQPNRGPGCSDIAAMDPNCKYGLNALSNPLGAGRGVR
jgi:hypothetical protein